MAALIALCADPDPSARKFACFAIGNAGEARAPGATPWLHATLALM